MLIDRETVYESPRGLVARTITQTEMQDNAVTRYEYEEDGRLRKVTDALGHSTRHLYNTSGQQIAMIDARGNRVDYEYDPASGQRTHVKLDDPQHNQQTSIATAYDVHGRRVSITDQLGQMRFFSHDAAGRLTRVELPEVADAANSGIMTAPEYRYGYDGRGNMVSITDPRDKTTGFEYDHFNRLVMRTLPAGESGHESEFKRFDMAGRIARERDFNHAITIHEYDERGLLSARRHFENDAGVEIDQFEPRRHRRNWCDRFQRPAQARRWEVHS